MGRRIRTVKPEWLDDELLALASSDARVLSIALILLSDDHGRGRANLVILAGQVFPGKPLDVLTGALGELVAMHYVAAYDVDGQSYFQIRNWSKHQRIEKSTGPSKFPDPLEDIFTGKIPLARVHIPSIPFHSQISEKGSQKDRPTKMPDHWPLTEKHLKHAEEKGWPAWWMELAHEQFCNFARSTAKKFVEWDPAFYNNCRAQIGWGKGPKDLAHLAPKTTQPNAAYEARQATTRREIEAQTAKARAKLAERGISVPEGGTVAIGGLLAKVGH